MGVPPTRRIVLLGKSGVGKSSLGNTIFGETVFKTNQLLVSQKSTCQAEAKLVKGRNVTLIDTPGFFDMGTSEEDMKPEILQCIVESAPGPHAFVIVLKVEKVTDHEKDAISKMCQYFSEEALQHTVILFTHGDQLPEGMKIQEFVGQSEGLIDLVKKCGGRCHVIDNKYWNREAQDGYRNNQFQVEELLKTIEKIVTDNKGGYYTNELLQAVEREILEEEEQIRQGGNRCQKETREKTKTAVYKKNISKFTHLAGKGLMVGALLGSEAAVLISVIKGVNVIQEAQKKESPGTEKETSAGAAEGKGAAEDQAPVSPGGRILGAVVKGGEMAKTASGYLSLLKVLSGKDAGAEVTAEEEAAAQQGETLAPALGAAGAMEQVAVETAQEATASAAGETFTEAAAAFAVEEVVDGAAAAEGVAAAVEGLAEGGDTMATVIAAAEAAAEVCCVQ